MLTKTAVIPMSMRSRYADGVSQYSVVVPAIHPSQIKLVTLTAAFLPKRPSTNSGDLALQDLHGLPKIRDRHDVPGREALAEFDFERHEKLDVCERVPG